MRALALALPLALTLTACDSSDDDGMVDTDSNVYVTSNPAGAGSDSIVRFSSDLATTQTTFTGLTGVASIQSVFITDEGDGYITVDLAGTTGGIVYADNLCDEGGAGCTNAGVAIGAGTRLVAGAATGLIAPKGIVNSDDKLFVADNGGSGAIRVFAESATGNVAPLFTVTNITGATNVWDVAYDDGDDRLFVAGTNGVVLVYDQFVGTQGANGPTRVITPATAAGVKLSVNLHGIAYDERTDILVLTDVGVAAGGAFATDGQVFTIANASTASGNVAPRYRVSGATAGLGNPVDAALSTSGVLYVAEKANSTVLRYDGILTATGDVSTAASATATVAAAESVTIANQ